MVGVVVVSHSPRLAHAAVELALQMVHGPAPRIEIAAGTSDDRLGTDAVRVAQAIVAADDGAGVVVIMDLGSAVLSAELAVDLVPDAGIKTRLVSAAFVEASLRLSLQRPAVQYLTLWLGMPRKLCTRSRHSWAGHRLPQLTPYPISRRARLSRRRRLSTRTVSTRGLLHSLSEPLPHSMRRS